MMAAEGTVHKAGVEQCIQLLSTSTVSTTKQQKKEEGRRRALEIALSKQKQSNNLNTDVNAGSKRGRRANRKSVRHGARNQHRHKHFARWILERFPHILKECNSAKENEKSSCKTSDSTSDDESTRMHILDVAGGKGELSARLSFCHSLNVIMIDPRPADIASVYMNTVVPKLPKKWQSSIKERLLQSPTFVEDELGKRFSQLVMPFSAPSYFATPTDEVESCFQDEKLDSAVRNASLLVGLHADGATEAIVDAALLYGKPFVVVPCCVFPNLFRERYISVPLDDTPDGQGMIQRESVGNKPLSCITVVEGNTRKEKRVPVRTHDQFCKYLLAKDPRFVMEVLPFEGRNTAIWWRGR